MITNTVHGTIGHDHYKLELHTPAGHHWLADEPEELNGSNLAPAPDELLCSALAACAAITMRMYADRKGWDLERIDITVSLERQQDQSTDLRKQVKFTGNLNPEDAQRLLAIGDKCPVHKTLLNPIRIQTVLL